jgi:hypothetical protein
MTSSDERVRSIARRALARIRDPRFAARDSFPSPIAPPHYHEPALRLRYRQLGAKDASCSVIQRGLDDRESVVRLRAMDLLTPACVRDADLRNAR